MTMVASLNWLWRAGIFRVKCNNARLLNHSKAIATATSVSSVLNVFLTTLSCLGLAGAWSYASDTRGNQFFGYEDFSSFKRTDGDKQNRVVLVSPEIAARAL